MLPLAAGSIASERSPMQAGTMASKCHTLIMETNAVYFPTLNWLPIGLNLLSWDIVYMHSFEEENREILSIPEYHFISVSF